MRALKLLDRASSALAARLEAELAALLSRGAPPAEVARLAGRRMDEAIEAARARAPLLAPACAAGCSWCCHVHVDATLPEIDAVIAHLEATRSPEERSVIAAAAERAAALDDGARWEARIPCALLDEGGRCSVYEARPLRCRAFHSCAVEACREAFEGRAEADALPLESQVVRRAADAALRGYERALIQRGIDAEPRRLDEALAGITAR